VTPEENRRLVLRFFAEVFNTGDVAAVDAFIHPEHENHDPTAPDVPAGPEGVRRLVELYRGAFPDLRFDHEMLFATDEWVAHRWTFTGTHRGEVMGIDATGRQVAVDGLEVNRIADGKIAESWALSDSAGLLEQLGARPSAP
jgi:steroid delta-isomerase-like uncharacterized protein